MRLIPTLADSTIHEFRKHAFEAAQPRRLPAGLFKQLLPAAKKWFSVDIITGLPALNKSYFASQDDFAVPVEVVRHEMRSSNGTPKVDEFTRIDLLMSQFIGMTGDPQASNNHSLYVAQCSLSNLGSGVGSDIPTPAHVLKSGRGEIYDASIWLGLSPTYTPLHKDPNPNLFVQLAGRKAVRIFSPQFGRAIFQESLRRAGSEANASFRGEEMMVGAERTALEQLVWSDEESSVVDKGHEAMLENGDGLFIPTGWWHSFKGIDRGMNGSVNWWFR